jgi:hypothetical protein
MTQTDTASRPRIPTTSERARWMTPAVVVVALVPLIASAVSMAVRVGTSFAPSADQALIELQIRDIGHQPVLLGPYSRFGWFHPGPLLYYVLWLPYRLTGSTAVSLVVAALVVNGLAVVGIALIARRRGGDALLLLTLFALGLLMRSLGAQFLRDVWNPSIPVLPLVLLVFLAWATSAGDLWAVPVAAGVATFLVQTHVSYGLLALTVSIVGVAGLAVTEWRRRPPSPARRRAWFRSALVTIGVLAVLWLPVLVQQVFRDPGNASTLYHFFRDHGREQSYAHAWHVMASQLSAWPEWLRGRGKPNIYTGAVDLSGATPLAVGLVALVGAAVVAWFRGKDAFRLDVIVLAAVAAGFVAVTRIVGEIFPYLVRWSWAVGMLAWLAIVWTVVTAWQARRSTPSARDRAIGRWALVLVGAGFVVVTVMNTASAIDAGNPDPYGSRFVHVLTRDVQSRLPRGDGVVEIRSIGGAGSTWTGAGIADQLEKDGQATRVEPSLEFAYGPDRVLDGERVKLVVLPVETGELAEARALPGFVEIGRAGRIHLFVHRPPR